MFYPLPMRTWKRQSTSRLNLGLFCPEDAWQGIQKRTRNRSLRCPQSRSTGWIWRHRHFGKTLQRTGGLLCCGQGVTQKAEFIQSITFDSRWRLSRFCFVSFNVRVLHISPLVLQMWAWPFFFFTAVYSSLDAYCAHIPFLVFILYWATVPVSHLYIICCF